MLYQPFETGWANSIHHTTFHEKARMCKLKLKTVLLVFVLLKKLVIENDLEKKKHKYVWDTDIRRSLDTICMIGSPSDNHWKASGSVFPLQLKGF